MVENEMIKSIQPNDYELITQLDRKIYPTGSPVSIEAISNWYQRNPEFGMIYERDKKVQGVCIAIPLNASGWRGLIEGRLAESELGNDTLFDAERDGELGVHVYHIEKLDGIEHFHKIILDDLAKVVNSLKQKNPSLELIGFSGLCVSPEGIDLFKNKFDCKERDYKSNEHILIDNNCRRVLVKSDLSDEEVAKQYPDLVYLNRCKMLVLYPNEESIVWRALNE